ncbi:General secretory system II protein E domain protein [Stanieria cyanosphaera PCC 7437]|uniref:General secretory system II protein E domain protein n=1 Tax=Stanieria cyanosphaera (strain ATCC 29371 / PCC 7437) TaxID=111780 RepID=K9XRZ2_STAC7|nr:general secretion pathway protein GspE [Stanieria cyanosphaera]AFZ35375.1 General secretory system II protein E domain protein [Stanieria cyanosphaera PCC 7437]
MSYIQDLAQSNSQPPKSQRLKQKFQPTKTNPARIFELINTLLPVRYCLSHKVVPLELSQKCLTLGMVNPEQHNLLEGIRSICGHQIESFHLQPIEAHTHQLILSAYIQHSRQKRSRVAIPKQPIQERPTLLIDAPEQLPKITEQVDAARTKLPATHVKNIQTLEIKARYLSAPVEFLAALPPQVLWQELLGRVLEQGIGRLYFERLANSGRVLWSQNGALKLSFDSLDLKIFQGVLVEFKKFAGLPTIPVATVQQGELEHYYQEEKLLIRWRIHQGEYGEEATIQILRGKALELYQRRQIKEWEEQALDLAKKLEQKLQQIREFKQNNPLSGDNLASLQQIQLQIKRQLDLLT